MICIYFPCTYLTDRETLEECCLEVTKIEHIGKIIFEVVGDKQLMEVHVFLCDEFMGTPTETEGKAFNMLVLNLSSEA